MFSNPCTTQFSFTNMPLVRKDLVLKSPLFVCSYKPSLEKHSWLIFALGLMVYHAALVAKYQSLTVPSSDPGAISLPSGENATALTQPVSPLRVCSGAPVAES
jgi:hypothetical protein